MGIRPVSIGYIDLINRFPGFTEEFESLKKEIAQGNLFGEISKWTIPLVPKEIFFEVCSKFMKERITSSKRYYPQYSKHYVTECYQSMGTIIFSWLDEINDICVHTHRVDITDQCGNIVSTMENADLGTLIKLPEFRYGGTSYRDALHICGSVYNAMVSDNNLRKFCDGTGKFFNFLTESIDCIKAGDTILSEYSLCLSLNRSR